MQQSSELLKVTFEGPSHIVIAALRDGVGGMGLTAADMVELPEGNVLPMVRPSRTRTTKTS